MKTSNLQLDNYFVSSFSFAMNDGFEKGKTENNLSPSFNVKCDYENVGRKKYQRKCKVQIELTEGTKDSFPYRFNIALYGLFTINRTLTSEDSETLFRVNAPALLYSAAREIVFSMTNHTEHQGFLLPSVTFIDEVKSVEKEAKGEAKPKRRVTKK